MRSARWIPVMLAVAAMMLAACGGHTSPNSPKPDPFYNLQGGTEGALGIKLWEDAASGNCSSGGSTLVHLLLIKVAGGGNVEICVTHNVAADYWGSQLKQASPVTINNLEGLMGPYDSQYHKPIA
jgi:hypothetical protein